MTPRASLPEDIHSSTSPRPQTLQHEGERRTRSLDEPRRFGAASAHPSETSETRRGGASAAAAHAAQPTLLGRLGIDRSRGARSAHPPAEVEKMGLVGRFRSAFGLAKADH